MGELIPIAAARKGPGGARAGAGRKPGSASAVRGKFVYVLHEVDEPTVCKIGIANDPYKRISGHQVSSWRRLTLSAVFTAPSADIARTLERAVHRALNGVHVLGEWFRIPPDRAQAEIVATAISMGIEIEPFDRSHLK